MKLSSISFHSCSIPFRFSYGHAAAHHRAVNPVLCIIRDTEGNQGIGEAVPRTYVTGETVDSVMTDGSSIAETVIPSSITPEEALNNFNRWTDTHPDTKPFPSCACSAIDGALVSLIAQQQGRPLYTFLGATTQQLLTYSGSIGVGSTIGLLPKLLMYKLMGFRNFKVKVATTADIKRTSLIRQVLGSNITIFADANCAWTYDEAVRNIALLKKAGVWAIEEPLKNGKGKALPSGQVNREALLDTEHFKKYHRLKREVALPLIADESLISPASMQKIIEHDAFSIANIRISKCGGTQVSSRMYDQAEKAGMTIGLGAMVGESPVLATIGSHFGAAHPTHLYIQGHSHRLLHRCRIAEGEPAMKRGGKMRLPDVPGTGIRLDTSIFQRVTTATKEILL